MWRYRGGGRWHGTRLTLGNLGFKTTRESVAEHFKEAAGHIPSVRLLTEKPTGSQPPKSRGIAFLELLSSEEMQKCLKLHHSILNGRRINVELTAGGGGKSAARKGKIAERNERVGVQRERRAEKEKAEGGGDKDEVVGAGAGNAWREEKKVDEDVNGYKMRGGRRVKGKKVSGAKGYADFRTTQVDRPSLQSGSLLVPMLFMWDRCIVLHCVCCSWYSCWYILAVQPWSSRSTTLPLHMLHTEHRPCFAPSSRLLAVPLICAFALARLHSAQVTSLFPVYR